jgi:hypothetical protein
MNVSVCVVCTHSNLVYRHVRRSACIRELARMYHPDKWTEHLQMSRAEGKYFLCCGVFFCINCCLRSSDLFGYLLSKQAKKNSKAY